MGLGEQTVKRAVRNALSESSNAAEIKILIIDANGNIISDLPLSALTRMRVYEQTFEDGTSDLTANNATQTVQSTTVYAGTYSLQVTIPAGQTGYVETPMRPVSPGQQVTFSFAHLEDANITDVKLVVIWYRANGVELSTEVFTLTPNTTNWQLEGRTVTAPQNAAYMALRMQATASATADGNVFLDDITIDLVGQIYRTTGDGKIMVADEDLLNELVKKLNTADLNIDPTTKDLGIIINSDNSGILKSSDLDIDATTKDLGIKIDADNVGLAKETTLSSVDTRLSNLELKLSQALLTESALSYDNSAGTTTANYTVFATDVSINFNGKIVIQIIIDQTTTAQLKVTPAGQTTAYTGYINEGNNLQANSWYEFEFEVNNGDAINVVIQVPAGAVLSGYLRIFKRER